jgi:hypothetical protein
MARGRRRGRGGAKGVCIDSERAQRRVRFCIGGRSVARLLRVGDGARRRGLRGRGRRSRCCAVAVWRREGGRRGRRAVFVWVRDAQSAEGLRQAQVAIHRGSHRAAWTVNERKVTGSKGTARSASGATRSGCAAEAGVGGMGAPRGQYIRAYEGRRVRIARLLRPTLGDVDVLALPLTKSSLLRPAQAPTPLPQPSTRCIMVCCLCPRHRPPSVPGLRAPV